MIHTDTFHGTHEHIPCYTQTFNGMIHTEAQSMVHTDIFYDTNTF